MAEIERRRIVNRDGLALAVTIHGPGNPGRPVVCLAGLTRNGRDFARFAERLASDPQQPRRVVSIDTRGRGDSDRDPDPARYTVPVEAGDVEDVLDAIGIAEADMIGTSRGGLILHLLAVTRPARLARVVLNDIGPELGLDGLRKIRAYLSAAPRPVPPAAAIAALKAQHGADFPALAPDDWADMADAIFRQTPEGLVPDVDPAIPAAFAALDLSVPLPDLWQAYDAFAPRPLLVVRGACSTLLTAETAARMIDRHPAATLWTAPGEGHAPLLHRDATYRRLSAFLADP